MTDTVKRALENELDRNIGEASKVIHNHKTKTTQDGRDAERDAETVKSLKRIAGECDKIVKELAATAK